MYDPTSISNTATWFVFANHQIINIFGKKPLSGGSPANDIIRTVKISVIRTLVLNMLCNL
jgi:hypothetical protein